MAVFFIDTTVLCNLIPVPGRDNDRNKVLSEMVALAKTETLILPVTAVIETGNFIAQLESGGSRRIAATTLDGLLRLSVSNQAPYVLHDFHMGLGVCSKPS